MFADRDRDRDASPPNRQNISQDAGLDPGKIDEAVLAILYTSAFDENGIIRAWKGINWDSTNRLFELGFISYPRTPSKSVVFTQEGVTRAREAAQKLFGQAVAAGAVPGLYEVLQKEDQTAGVLESAVLESTFY